MQNEQDLRQEKREKFAHSAARTRLRVPVWAYAIGGLLVVVLAAVLWPGGADGDIVEDGELPVRDGAVRLPIAAFDDEKAHWYTYRADGTGIQFFVLKSSDGVVRAAFNACDVCFLEKKGYRHEGDEVICNNCGQRFPSSLINEVRGGCNPSPLNRTIEGDELVIRIEDILSGAGYF